MVKLTSAVCDYLENKKFCDVFLNFSDIDYENVSKIIFRPLMSEMAGGQNCHPIIKILNDEMYGMTENAIVNAISSFSNDAKDKLLSTYILSSSEQFNEQMKKYSLMLVDFSSYDKAENKGTYNFTFEAYTIERRQMLIKCDAKIFTDNKSALNDKILSFINEKPNFLMKAAANIFTSTLGITSPIITGKLQNFINENLMSYGICIENLKIS